MIFFGDEGINVLKHLKFLVSTKSVSQCSNGNECPEKVKVTRRNDFPVISNACPHKEEFVSIIKLWLIGSNISSCRLQLQNQDINEEIVEWIPKRYI